MHKQKEQGETLLYEEYDELEKAQQRLATDFKFVFSYHRRGWEYHLNGAKIYVEEIEELEPSVEILAPDLKIIEELFDQLKIVKNVGNSVSEEIRLFKNIDVFEVSTSQVSVFLRKTV